jgi:hypothetical protein
MFLKFYDVDRVSVENSIEMCEVHSLLAYDSYVNELMNECMRGRLTLAFATQSPFSCISDFKLMVL